MLNLVCSLLLLCSTDQTARYARLTLLDGQVVTGQVLQEDDDHVRLRVVKMGGKVTYVREIAKRHIARREVVELEQQTAAALKESLAEPPVEPPVELSGADPADDPQAYLARTMEEWHVRNVEVAARRLLRLLAHATGETLESLDAAARREVGVPLRTFAAQVYLEYALLRSENGYFRLYFLNGDTLRPMHALLSQALAETIAATVVCPLRGLDNHRCDRVDSIAHWLRAPQRYDGDPEHARHFARHLTRAMGMNRELLRLSQALHADAAQMIALRDQGKQLRVLFKVVNQRKLASAASD